MYDVLVAGGGPIGSRVAGILAGEGHKILVLERKKSPGGKSCCTGIIGCECAATFNIEDHLILRRLNSASLFSPSGQRLYLHRPETQALVLDRAAFDMAMTARAQHAGAEYRFDSLVSGAFLNPDHVAVTVSARAKEETIPARAVVIACGFAPGLLWRLGLGTFGDSALGAQAEVEAPGTAEVAVYFGDVAPGFFAWLVPTAPALARAGLLARKRPGDYLKRWLDSLAREGRIRSAAVNISYGGVPLKPLAHSFGTRMVVVGDAAGQVKPTTGGGIYYGLLCADIAAATLHRALVDDDLSAKRLAAYERAWRRKLGRELQTGYWARKLFESLSNRRIDRLFKLIEAGGIDEALLKAADLSFDWHGRTMLRLLKYQVIARTLKFGRLPFSFQKSPR